MSSELEALSNKELRAKCIEYGMPNVPVTDSSRKVLLRRLEAAISGKPLTPVKTTANRRETMHVSKPSAIASSPKITINNNVNASSSSKPTPVKDNRPSRRTIAAVTERHVATTTTVSEPEYSDVSPDRVEQQPIMIAKAKTPERPPTLYPKLPAKEPSPKPQMLSKTGVVSTSYVQEKKSTPTKVTYAAPDDIDSAEEDMRHQPVIKPAISITPLQSYVPLSEARVTTTNPVSSSLSSSTRYSALGSSGTSYNYIQPATSTFSTLSTSSNVRKTYGEPTVTSYNQYSRLTPSLLNKYADADLEYEDEDEEEDEEEYDDDVVLVEDSPVGKDIDTPFLSQFARNLENLKATPLRHSVGPTKITPPKSVAALRQRENLAYARRTVGGGGGGGGYTGAGNIAPRRSLKEPVEESPFRQMMMSLEEKYHLKQTFLIISIFIIAVFIYVFFIQSV